MYKSKDRRNFLKLLITSGALAASTPVVANEKGDSSNEKVKMLAEDGTLVEIDRKVLDKIKTGKKVPNDVIRNFIQTTTKNRNEGKRG